MRTAAMNGRYRFCSTGDRGTSGPGKLPLYFDVDSGGGKSVPVLSAAWVLHLCIDWYRGVSQTVFPKSTHYSSLIITK